MVEFEKLNSSSVDTKIDRQKLLAYKRDPHYDFALFVALGVSRDVGKLQVEWL